MPLPGIANGKSDQPLKIIIILEKGKKSETKFFSNSLWTCDQPPTSHPRSRRQVQPRPVIRLVFILVGIVKMMNMHPHHCIIYTHWSGWRWTVQFVNRCQDLVFFGTLTGLIIIIIIFIIIIIIIITHQHFFQGGCGGGGKERGGETPFSESFFVAGLFYFLD